MTENEIMTIRLLPDGFYISEQFHPVAPGADFEQRLKESMLDAEVSALCEPYSEQNSDSHPAIRCVVETSRFCLSPLTESNETATKMYSLTTATPEKEEVQLQNTDETDGIRFTYGINAEIYHFLNRILPGIEFQLDAYRLHLEKAYKEACLVAKQGMLVKASAHAVTLLAYHHSHLQLCNRIETQGDTNQCYYIMSAWAQLGFDPLEDTLILENATDNLRQTLNTYIKCVL